MPSILGTEINKIYCMSLSNSLALIFILNMNLVKIEVNLEIFKSSSFRIRNGAKEIIYVFFFSGKK